MKIKLTNILRISITCYLLLITCYYLSGCATVPKIDIGMPTVNLRGAEYISVIDITNKFNFAWDYDTVMRKVTLTRGNNEIRLMPDSKIVLVNGESVNLGRQVEMYKGQVFVPVKFKQDVIDVLYPTSIPCRISTSSTQIKDFKLVVLDAGHGGNDPGAVGRHGLREKDVSLDIVQRIKRILQANGLNIIMTRNSDKFIQLPTRAEIANNKKADLFISVHINANPSRKLSGFEVYYLSDRVDDRSRALLAAENASFNTDSSSFADNNLSLKATLWDMIYSQNRAESIDLANNICRTASDQMGLRILGVKGAPFYVLKWTQMPAVLVEAGFVSNSEEEKYMRNSSYRQQLAEAIAQGVINYCRNFENMRAKR